MLWVSHAQPHPTSDEFPIVVPAKAGIYAVRYSEFSSIGEALLTISRSCRGSLDPGLAPG
jgi:hypothetical protein